MKYDSFTFDGLAGGSISIPKSDICYIKISVDVHTIHTTKTQALMSIYPEMLLSGTKSKSREEFLDAINKLGATISINFDSGVCTFALRGLATSAPKLLSCFVDMIENPAFTSKEIKRVQQNNINLLSEAAEEARTIAWNSFRNALFTAKDRRYHDHPTVESGFIKSINHSDLQTFHKQIQKAPWTVTIGGTDKLIEPIKKELSRLKSKYKTEVIPHTHAPRKKSDGKLTLTSIPSKQNIEFSIGQTLPLTILDKDFAAFTFGLAVLGKWGGFTGRLMSTIREKEGLTYGIYARTETVSASEQGYWRIMTFFAPDKSVKALESTMREIKKIYQNGITNAELVRFRSILKTQQVLRLDSFTSSIDEFHYYLFNNFSIEEMSSHKKRLLDVTQTEVNKTLKKYLDPNNLVIAGAGPTNKVEAELKKNFS